MQGAALCIRPSPCKSLELKKEMKMGSQQVQRPIDQLPPQESPRTFTGAIC